MAQTLPGTAFDLGRWFSSQPFEFDVGVGDVFGGLEFSDHHRERDMVEKALEAVTLQRIGQLGSFQQLLRLVRRILTRQI
jgi:hypothetical protein